MPEKSSDWVCETCKQPLTFVAPGVVEPCHDKPLVGPCCAANLERAKDIGYVKSDGYAQDGDEWSCPTCWRKFVHVCDEASGCCWSRVEG